MVKVGDYMSWIDTRSDIDKEIANCYSQIEELNNKIKQLEMKKSKEQRIYELTKQFRYEEVYGKETTTNGKLKWSGVYSGEHIE